MCVFVTTSVQVVHMQLAERSMRRTRQHNVYACGPLKKERKKERKSFCAHALRKLKWKHKYFWVIFQCLPLGEELGEIKARALRN